MLFCILQDPKTYDDIKRKAAFDLPVSVPTQVMLAKKAFNPKGVDQYAGNLLLKVCRSADGYRDAAESSPYPARPRAGNAKLSGINSTVDMAGVPRFAAGKTMLLGADVT